MKTTKRERAILSIFWYLAPRALEFIQPGTYVFSGKFQRFPMVNSQMLAVLGCQGSHYLQNSLPWLYYEIVRLKGLPQKGKEEVYVRMLFLEIPASPRITSRPLLASHGYNSAKTRT